LGRTLLRSGSIDWEWFWNLLHWQYADTAAHRALRICRIFLGGCKIRVEGRAEAGQLTAGNLRAVGNEAA